MLKGQSYRRSECRYLVQPEIKEGMGNKLMSTAASFLYAILTGRVFMTSAGSAVGQMLCQPFLNSNWHMPQSFDDSRLQHGLARMSKCP